MPLHADGRPIGDALDSLNDSVAGPCRSHESVGHVVYALMVLRANKGVGGFGVDFLAQAPLPAVDGVTVLLVLKSDMRQGLMEIVGDVV